MAASESVQYFQFDQDGNMYVFRPGSGFSGPSVKVEPGFEMAEVKDLTQSLYEVGESEVHTKSDVFEMSQVLSVISTIESEIIAPTLAKR